MNRGIIQAHESGIVTSASMMVRWPAADEAAAYGRERRGLSLGLHLDLGEWARRGETWVSLYRVVDMDDVESMRDAALCQLETFRRLVGRDPTHIDSHQHVHMRKSIRPMMIEMARELGVPLRRCAPEVTYIGDFYGQTGHGDPLPDQISVESLTRLLATLPEGLTELGCHPGLDNDVDSMYVNERSVEVKTLCHPQVRAAIDYLGIRLRSFGGVNQ